MSDNPMPTIAQSRHWFPRFRMPRIPDPLRPLFLKWLTRDSNLVKHAERELRIAGLFDKDSDYAGLLGPAVLQMVRQFSDEGHSGYSAGLAVSLFQKVARFEPLTPLTGEASEWIDHGDGHLQNNRCSHVFKDGNEQAYDSTGIIFREPNGACYQGFGSRVPITFPYTPKTEYVDRPSDHQ